MGEEEPFGIEALPPATLDLGRPVDATRRLLRTIGSHSEVVSELVHSYGVKETTAARWVQQVLDDWRSDYQKQEDYRFIKFQESRSRFLDIYGDARGVRDLGTALKAAKEIAQLDGFGSSPTHIHLQSSIHSHQHLKAEDLTEQQRIALSVLQEHDRLRTPRKMINLPADNLAAVTASMQEDVIDAEVEEATDEE